MGFGMAHSSFISKAGNSVATRMPLGSLKKISLAAIGVLACVASQSAHACNISLFQCDPIADARRDAYDTTTTCTIRIARPQLDTGCSSLSAGISYATGRGIVMTATAASTNSWGAITFGPVLNDTADASSARRAIITGTVPLGGDSSMAVSLRVQGACGTSTNVVGNISDNLLRQESAPRVFSLPGCPVNPPPATNTPAVPATNTPVVPATNTPSIPPSNPSITLSADGIYDNGNGTFTAYFGYTNNSSSNVTIPVGSTSSTKNTFSPSPADRGQGTVFKPGINKGAVAVIFDGNPLTFTVQAAGGAESSVTVTSSSTPRLLAVEPLTQCVLSNSDGTFAAIMGYRNDNVFPIKLPVGETNKFEPGAQSRGQPSTFATGLNSGTFTVLNFTSALTWRLATKSAAVGTAATQCSCPTVGGIEIKAQLNEDALALNRLADKAAALLLSVNTKAAKKSSADVARRSKSNLEAIRAATLKIPNLIVSCPADGTPPQCVRVDNQASLISLQQQFDVALHIVKRGTARANFLKTGKTKPANGETDPLVTSAEQVYQRGIATLSGYPRFSTSCPRQ